MEKGLTWKWVEDFCKIDTELYTEIENKTTTIKFENKKFSHRWVCRYSAEQLDYHVQTLMLTGHSNPFKTMIRMYIKESKLEQILGEIII